MRFRDFIPEAWAVVEPSTPYVPNWHIDAMADHLEAVLAGEIRNLVITLPPRMMKSLTVSVFFPAWTWTFKPDKRFIGASYSATLSIAHNVLCRRLIESDWYRGGWGDIFRLTSDQNLKSRFDNDATGYRIATSVGGSVTGLGADIIVCDDPHNLSEVGSETIRAGVIDWWTQTMSTRLNDPRTGGKIIVMQRAHQNDLAGYVLEQGGYEHLNLPMEYEATAHVTALGWRDPRTDEGELLSPDRFGPVEVERAKETLGSRGFAGQMQQRPSPAEGGTFKRHWWQTYKGEPEETAAACSELVQSWDMSFRETKSGSYVVGQVWGAKGAHRYLIDQVRARMDFPTAVAAVRSLSAKWPKAVKKLVENKANGPAIVASLRGEIDGLIEVEPEGGKEARANAISPLVESGNVFLPEPAYAPWVHDFLEECAAFPNGTHDDQVDTMSQALVKMRKRKEIAAFDLSGLERADPLAWAK